MSADVIIMQERTLEENEQVPEILSGKKLSFQKLRRADSLEVESQNFRSLTGHGSKVVDWSTILHLASIGIVYGDIGTSPLYVYSSTFTKGINHNDDILGGTFALYSLICRYAKVSLIPNQQVEDENVSNYQLELANSKRLRRASRLKWKLENSKLAKYLLLIATMLGTSLVIGDGILTPCISVLSAVGGIKHLTPKEMTEDRIAWISVAILVCLFLVQRFGTDKVGYSFAPIICLWFLFIAIIGLVNFIMFDPTVIKAINPKYIVDYFRRNKDQAWISLGGVVLAITGTEAMFADLGYFTVPSVQISMCSIVYPSLLLAYTGQASYLRKHNDNVKDAFYNSIPDRVYWPMFIVAVMAAIIASQAMISGTFSIIQQALSLGCFPRVKIIHTSAKYEGQVYIPEINYLLMLACVGVTLGFKTTDKIGNAYGIAVVFVMTLTLTLLVIVMIMIWKTQIFLVITYVLLIGTVELLYLSSVLYKFNQGGYLPLAFSAVLMSIMYVWNYVYRKKYTYELEHKTSPEELKEIVADMNLSRLPGLAIFYSELVHGIPPIFKHSILLFISMKSLPISKVPVEERFLFRRVDLHELNIFRCVVRYGYTDVRKEHESFEGMRLERLKDFVIEEFCSSSIRSHNSGAIEGMAVSEEISEQLEDRRNEERKKEEAMEVVERGWRDRIVHLMGESEVVASKESGFGKKILVNYAYSFIRRNLRESSDKVFNIPHQHLLKVGMTYEL